MIFPNLITKKRLLLILLLLVILVPLYVMRQGSHSSKEGGDKKDKAKPVVVATMRVQQSRMPLTLEAIGNIEAQESVSIQPQMTGQLKKVHFVQGAYVQKGQLLFELDGRSQSAAVAQMEALISRSQASIRQARANLAKSSTLTVVAQANLKRDKAQQKFAALEVERYKKLHSQNYVALEQYQQFQNTLNASDATLVADQAAIENARAQIQADQAALQTALSSLRADQASLTSARIQLGFTRIYAPISGKTGPILINAGNNVQANSSVLVNIKRMSPIDVGFAVPEKFLPAFQQAMEHSGVSVTVSTKGDKPYQEIGQLSFIDNVINKNNGTVQLKGTFMNSENKLWPGLFVNVTAQLGIQPNALSIPAEAIQKGPNGDFVYVVEKQKAKVQPVVVDRIFHGSAIIAKGLKSQQEVIVTGLLALAPDMLVKVAAKKP